MDENKHNELVKLSIQLIKCKYQPEQRTRCIERALKLIKEGCDPTQWTDDQTINPFLNFSAAFALPLLKYIAKNKESYKNKHLEQILDFDGRNALHLCASAEPDRKKPMEILDHFYGYAKYLIDKLGFSMLVKDNYGYTVFHLALHRTSHYALKSLVQLFEERDKTRSPIRVYPPIKEKLMDDICNSEVDHVQSFLPYGKDNDGNSVFLFAVKKGITDENIYRELYRIDDNKLSRDNKGVDAYSIFEGDNKDLRLAAEIGMRTYDSIRIVRRLNTIADSIDKKSTMSSPMVFNYKNIYGLHMEGDVREFHDAGEGKVKLVSQSIRITETDLPGPNNESIKALTLDTLFNISSTEIDIAQEIPTRIEIGIGGKKLGELGDFPFILLDYDCALQLNDQATSATNPEAKQRLSQFPYLRIENENIPTHWRPHTVNSKCNRSVRAVSTADPKLFMASQLFEMEIETMTREKNALLEGKPDINKIQERIDSKFADKKALELTYEATNDSETEAALQCKKQIEEITKELKKLQAQYDTLYDVVAEADMIGAKIAAKEKEKAAVDADMKASEYNYHISGFTIVIQVSFIKVISITPVSA